MKYNWTPHVKFSWWGDIQFNLVTQSCLTLCNPVIPSTPGLPVHHQLQSLLKLMSIKLVMPSSHLILCRPSKFQENIYFCFSDYAKAIDCVDHDKLWKFWKRWEYQTTWPTSWETYMQVRKQQLELDMEQQTGSK